MDKQTDRITENKIRRMTDRYICDRQIVLSSPPLTPPHFIPSISSPLLGTMDLQGLQKGDYMQLLNFFPLNKMEIRLR